MTNLKGRRRALKAEIKKLEENQEKDTDPKLKDLITMKSLMLVVVELEIKIVGELTNEDSPVVQKWRDELALAGKKLRSVVLKMLPEPNEDEKKQMKELEDDGIH